MELKKCKNCGAFINSSEDFCSACSNILAYNKTILKGYFDSSAGTVDSIPNISSQTGVSPKIVENYMLENNIINSEEIEKTSFASLSY